MPSPFGHALAGLIVGLAGEDRKNKPGAAGTTHPRTHAPTHLRTVPWSLFLSCMFLAALPDIDYIYPPWHRGPTHSIGAVAIVALVTILATRVAAGHVKWRVVLLCSLAYLSHIVMDWLGEDPTINPGVMAFWPFSDGLFMSGWDLFRSTKRLEPLAPAQIAHNFRTLVQEIAILGPFLIWLLWRRRRRASREVR